LDGFSTQSRVSIWNYCTRKEARRSTLLICESASTTSQHQAEGKQISRSPCQQGRDCQSASRLDHASRYEPCLHGISPPLELVVAYSRQTVSNSIVLAAACSGCRPSKRSVSILTPHSSDAVQIATPSACCRPLLDLDWPLACADWKDTSTTVDRV
jgi:hypothetical protein